MATNIRFLSKSEAFALASIGADVRGWWAKNKSWSNNRVYKYAATGTLGKVGWLLRENAYGANVSDPPSRFWIEEEE